MLTYRVLNAVMFGRHCLFHFSFYEISHNNFQAMLLDVIVCTFHTVFLHLNDACNILHFCFVYSLFHDNLKKLKEKVNLSHKALRIDKVRLRYPFDIQDSCFPLGKRILFISNFTQKKFA